MKTPEEIKKGLGRPVAVHYHNDPEPRLTPRVKVELEQLHDAALAYIQKLEIDKAWAGENYDLMREELAQVQRERDAAVNELVGTCQVCLWEGTAKCSTCHFNAEAWNVHESNWEWRGAPE